ncbi:DUF1579 domain-containing protein [Brevundimonas sp. VNH65]|uniref:DUF1579 domain-containing protein n=1 Tax=Brevundimonas sp. VNH65 TaxID=3400917 RepID=UPI003BFDFEC0
MSFTRPFNARLFALVLLAAPASALAQAQHPMGTDEQREAMKTLAWMDGEWRGTATAMTGPGQSRTMPHTERIGTMLGGSLRVIEGRSHNDDGSTLFNAFAVISWDDQADRFMMRSYANGQATDVPIEADGQGFKWTVTTARGQIRYEMKLIDGQWIETGDYLMEGRPPMRVIEMKLDRIGDTGWPAAGAVSPIP